jgi:hypothetical protein
MAFRQIPRISGVDPKFARVIDPIRQGVNELGSGPDRSIRLSDIGRGLRFVDGKLIASSSTTSAQSSSEDEDTVSQSLIDEITAQVDSLAQAQSDFEHLANQQIQNLSIIATNFTTVTYDTNGYLIGFGGPDVPALEANEDNERDFFVRSDTFGFIRPTSSFVADAAYSLGDFVTPSEEADQFTGLVYEVTTAGTATAEPNWTDADDAGETVTSGAVTFTARAPVEQQPFIVGDIGGSETVGIDGGLLIDESVLYQSIENAASLSVLGRATGSSGVLADIQAGTDHQVLRRLGSVVGFGSIDLSQSDAVGTSRLALANIVQLTGQAVLGVSTAGAGSMAPIGAGTNDRVLRQTGDALNFGQLTAGMFPALVVPDAALSANVPLLNTPNAFSGHARFNSTTTHVATATFNATVLISSPAPRVYLSETGVSTNEGVWDIRADSEVLAFRTRTDADGVGEAWMVVSRTTTVVDEIELNATTIDLNGKVETQASASGAAGLNIPHGIAPSSPADGDIWTTTAGVFARINGATVQLATV